VKTKFILGKNANNRQRTRDKLNESLDALDSDKIFTVQIHELNETRRDAQNKLMWAWTAECMEFYGEKKKIVMSGQNKRDVLIPLLLLDPDREAEAAMCVDALNRIEDDEKQCIIAGRLLRTSEMSVKEFAAYLTALQLYWGTQGLNLTSDSDYYTRAMGKVIVNEQG